MHPIRLIEEQSLVAMPSLETAFYDGWVLRYAHGYTKRANSVSPLYDGQHSLEDKLKVAEAFFSERGLPTVFKLMPINFPSDLDERLAEEGYQHRDGAEVFGLAMEAPAPVPAPVRMGDEVHWLPLCPSPAWEAHTRLNEMKPKDAETLLRMLQYPVTSPYLLVELRQHDEPIATARVHMGQGMAWVFGVAVAPSQRRKGYGRLLMRHILHRLSGMGEAVYLQVELPNHGARALYEQLGFRYCYTYWYRQK